MKNSFFKEINGIFGFGCMRLPKNGDEVDYNHFEKMIESFLNAGFNYFDTAHGYIDGKSETAIRDCLSKNYSRDKFLLTNKLTSPYFNSQQDIKPFVESQLKLCGVDYFDFYLMHAQDKNNYKKFKECKAYETAYSLKKEGLIKHFGLSFHDKPEILEMILNEHPEVEIVQIQLNYIDWLDPSVEAKKVYEICEKFDKPVVVMEPVKGGSLVNLPSEVDKVFRDLNSGSNASLAIRYAASHKNICVVLSGMSDIEQMNDNINSMKNFVPINEKEQVAIDKVCEIFKNLNMIPCTSCRYCIEENKCPKNIRIPDIFSSVNAHIAFNNWNTKYYYDNILTTGINSKASECIKCGKCEKVCPQHLEIRKLLEKAVEFFGK